MDHCNGFSRSNYPRVQSLRYGLPDRFKDIKIFPIGKIEQQNTNRAQKYLPDLEGLEVLPDKEVSSQNCRTSGICTKAIAS